jgi:hypothetical protein
MTTTASRQERLGVAALAMLGWLPVATFWLYSKQIRIHRKYFPLLREFSGTEQHPAWIDHLAVLRDDLFLSLILVPALIFLSLYLRPRSGLLRWTWVGLSLLVATLLFVNLHSWGTVGRFLTGTALIDAVAFAQEQPAVANSYIGLRSVSKLALICLAMIVPFAVARRLWPHRLLVRAGAGLWAMILAAAVLAVTLSLGSSLVRLPVMRDFVVQSVEALTNLRPPPELPLDPGVSLPEHFRRLTRTPSTTLSPHAGTAADTDLLLFVLETGSRRFVDLARDLESFPTAKRLQPRSLVALHHHSASPATAESLFALFTGVYPARSLYSTCIVDLSPQGPPLPGFIASLRSRGYYTGIYLPFTSVVPLDKAIFSNVGFEKVYYAQQHPRVPGLGRDGQALAELKRDLTERIAAGRRYAIAYLPQVGHAPWADRPADRSVAAHGKEVARLQDQWLGEIVELLAAAGRLDRTTIVLTGDHGIRTTLEDPQFRTGFLDAYSFEVPLLIYAPASFKAPLRITAPTTHVDISPSLQELFGFAPAESNQGLPLWHEAMDQRRMYFLANWYFGADGYRAGGPDYFMFTDVLGLAFRSDHLGFSASQTVRDGGRRAAAKDAIDRFYAIQQRWVEAYLCRR